MGDKSVAQALHNSFAPQGGHRRFARGEHLFMTGGPVPGLFLIAGGSVRSYILTPGGHEQVLSVVGPGDIVGEVSLADGGTANVSVQALEDTLALFIPRSVLEERLEVEPELALVARTLAQHTRRLTESMHDLLYLDARRRVIKQLIVLAEGRQGEPLPPLRQQDLAGLAGASRETASRVISELSHLGLVLVRGRRLRVTDLEGLRSLLGAALPTDGRGRPYPRSARAPAACRSCVRTD